MCDCRFFYFFYFIFLTAPFSRFTEVLYLQRCLVVACLVPRETAGVSARSVQTIQLRTMSRHFMQSHILREHVCLALTCHLQFWQNGRDLSRATVITRVWNGYRRKKSAQKSDPGE